MIDQQHKVRRIIEEIHPLSAASLELLFQITEFQNVQKGCFIKKNEANRSEYFILEGIVRTYVLNPEGAEMSLSFFQENAILSPYKTRTANGLSRVFAQAVTPTQLALIDAEKFFYLQANNQELRTFAVRVLENELIQKTEKEIAMASCTAAERLARFRQQFLGLENRVPHSYIASYLGITHVSFSRLRATIGRKNGK